MQDDAEKTTIDRQRTVSFVRDEAELLEFIQEKTDPRTGCSDHLCQVFLVDSGHEIFCRAFLAIMRQQQENPSQALLAIVEKLIDQILFKSDVAHEQMTDE